MTAPNYGYLYFLHFIYSELYAKIEARLKKYVFPAFLIVGVLLSFTYTVLSYVFVDKPLLTILGQTKPGVLSAIDSLQRNIPIVYVNRVGAYLAILLFLVAMILVFSKKTVGKSVYFVALLIPCLLAFAYPMMSRDIYSYLYYAKMVVIHHQNPYLITPLANSASELWLGFVHNVDRVYAYGPIALLSNLIPMVVLGAEKLIVNVYFYKLTCLVFFMVGSWLLLRLTRNRSLVLVLWILNPFILNELLINNHNDLLMIVFFWWAIDLKENSKTLMSLLAYSLSVGTKFVTAPLLPILFLSKKWQTALSTLFLTLLPIFLIYHGYLTWYFSWFYFCLPFLKLTKTQILSLLLLQLSLTFGYAGFLETGMWGHPSSNLLIVTLANATNILIALFILTMVYPFLRLYIAPRASYRKRHDENRSKGRRQNRGNRP
jgi:hypothetical protein